MPPAAREARTCGTPRCHNEPVTERRERGPRWDPDRNETQTERLDRNWSTLLQELRVVQTGVTLLTGFLLTLPFQPRFAELDDAMRVTYLVTVGCSIAATVLLVAPVAIHRLLFRRRLLGPLVAMSHRLAVVGLALFGLALAGVAALIFHLVLGAAAAWIAGGCTLVALAGFWLILPLRKRVTRA